MIRQELEYFFGALRFFTRLPVPAWVGHSQEHLNQAARYFPAVGLVVGVIAALTWWCSSLFWPKTIAMLLVMFTTIYATGAFHEDALADMVDGFGGGWQKSAILAIMKDSRSGSFGIVALVLILLGRFMALVELPDQWIVPALLAAHSVSRFYATTLLYTMTYVREDAESKSKPLATRMHLKSLIVAAVFALLPCMLLPPGQVLISLALATLVTLWLAALFRKWLGGYTGDCLGSVQQTTELAFYLGLLAQWPEVS